MDIMGGTTSFDGHAIRSEPFVLFSHLFSVSGSSLKRAKNQPNPMLAHLRAAMNTELATCG